MEGLPLSSLEAHASGTPVIAAPTAGIPEVVTDGKTGFLVTAADAPGYTRHFLSLIRNPTLCSQIAESAYETVVREYSWKTYLARTLEIYQVLL